MGAAACFGLDDPLDSPRTPRDSDPTTLKPESPKPRRHVMPMGVALSPAMEMIQRIQRERQFGINEEEDEETLERARLGRDVGHVARVGAFQASADTATRLAASENIRDRMRVAEVEPEVSHLLRRYHRSESNRRPLMVDTDLPFSPSNQYRRDSLTEGARRDSYEGPRGRRGSFSRDGARVSFERRTSFEGSGGLRLTRRRSLSFDATNNSSTR